jgi:hypothetical protein
MTSPKLKLINSWRSRSKQFDKINVEVRISSITVFNLSIDISSKSFRIVICNFGISN